MSAPQHAPESIAGRGMSRGLILLFAVATGQAVACNYLAQPLLDTIRDLFGVSAAVAGLIVTAAQIGYAAGLILLLPLGDLFERRRLITTLAAITVAGLAAAAVAPSIGFFIAAAGVIGTDVGDGAAAGARSPRRWRRRPSAAASSARS